MATTPDGHILAHDDHGLDSAHLRFIDTLLHGWDGSFQILVVEMPEECPDLLSALYGPAAGDEPIAEREVVYETRGNRRGPSRLVNRPHRPCRRMVLVAGPGRDEPIIYTAYGTQAEEPSPREPWDRSLSEDDKIVASAFWAQHALAA